MATESTFKSLSCTNLTDCVSCRSSLIIDGLCKWVGLLQVSCVLTNQTPFLALRPTRTQDWGFLFRPMRKTISKHIRFEVFKRDKFTCQYCGQSAPTVILNIDHIHPVSKGGKNDIMNLLTACVDCNSGKRDKVLSDDSALIKQKAQMDDLQERTNQIKLMSLWQNELVKQDHEKTQIALDVISGLFGVGLSKTGLKHLRNRIKSFGIVEVCEAMRIAHSQYYDGTNESIEECLKKSGGICYNRHYERERAKNG